MLSSFPRSVPRTNPLMEVLSAEPISAVQAWTAVERAAAQRRVPGALTPLGVADIQTLFHLRAEAAGPPSVGALAPDVEAALQAKQAKQDAAVKDLKAVPANPPLTDRECWQLLALRPASDIMVAAVVAGAETRFVGDDVEAAIRVVADIVAQAQQ